MDENELRHKVKYVLARLGVVSSPEVHKTNAGNSEGAGAKRSNHNSYVVKFTILESRSLQLFNLIHTSSTLFKHKLMYLLKPRRSR